MTTITMTKPALLPLKRQYRREGFAIAKNYLNAKQLDSIREEVASLANDTRADRSETVVEFGADNSCLNYDIRLAPPKLVDFGLSEQLINLLRLMTEWDQALLYDYYIFKKPEGAPRTPWHRDGDYLPIDGELCTLWIPLDPYEKALQYASGTNRLEPTESLCESQEQLDRLFTRPGVKVYNTGSMNVGDVDVHNHKVWHLGPGNTTAKSRQAIAFTYVPVGSHVRLDPKGFNSISGFQQRNSHLQAYFNGRNNIALEGHHLIKAY